MFAREVREELDDKNATAESVGSALCHMAKTGEVMQDRTASGSFAYLIDPDYKPKRAPAQVEPDVPPPARKSVENARAPMVAASAAQARGKVVAPTKHAAAATNAVVKAGAAIPVAVHPVAMHPQREAWRPFRRSHDGDRQRSQWRANAERTQRRRAHGIPIQPLTRICAKVYL
ncbi:MAG: hypothetical protein ACREPT_00820 [Rudaea sp.]